MCYYGISVRVLWFPLPDCIVLAATVLGTLFACVRWVAYKLIYEVVPPISVRWKRFKQTNRSYSSTKTK